MKKIFTLILLGTIITASLTGCSNSKTVTKSNSTEETVSGAIPFGDMKCFFLLIFQVSLMEIVASLFLPLILMLKNHDSFHLEYKYKTGSSDDYSTALFTIK